MVGTEVAAGLRKLGNHPPERVVGDLRRKIVGGDVGGCRAVQHAEAGREHESSDEDMTETAASNHRCSPGIRNPPENPGELVACRCGKRLYRHSNGSAVGTGRPPRQQALPRGRKRKTEPEGKCRMAFL